MNLLKNQPFKRHMISMLLLAYCLLGSGCTTLIAQDHKNQSDIADSEHTQSIILKTMGSFMFGGTLTKTEEGETFHGDHGYAQYYIPRNSREYPLVMWHGMGQSGKSWESTPDGREGFMSILPRHDWSVYIIDQPRRGRAGYTKARSSDPGAIPTTARESSVWNAFRNGVWAPPEVGSREMRPPSTSFSASRHPTRGKIRSTRSIGPSWEAQWLNCSA